MGSNLAYEMASGELEDMGIMLDLDTQLKIHLTSNHYPPVPVSMVKPCIEAIDAYWEGDFYREIEMPVGITYKLQKTAPAWAIAEQHHLEAWLPEV